MPNFTKINEFEKLVDEEKIQASSYEEGIENGEYDCLRIVLPSGDVISVISGGLDRSYLSVDVY